MRLKLMRFCFASLLYADQQQRLSVSPRVRLLKSKIPWWPLPTHASVHAGPASSFCDAHFPDEGAVAFQCCQPGESCGAESGCCAFLTNFASCYTAAVASCTARTSSNLRILGWELPSCNCAQCGVVMWRVACYTASAVFSLTPHSLMPAHHARRFSAPFSMHHQSRAAVVRSGHGSM